LAQRGFYRADYGRIAPLPVPVRAIRVLLHLPAPRVALRFMNVR
jgi:hypothetical protein